VRRADLRPGLVRSVAIFVAILAVASTAKSGDLLVSSTATHRVARYDALSGAHLGDFIPPGSGGLAGPFGMEFGPDGRLYVASDGQQVLRYDGTSGAFAGVFASHTSIDRPLDLAFGPDCNLYALGHNAGNVVRFDGTTGAFIDQFVPSGSGPGLSVPQVMAFGPDGHLYVGNFGGDAVQRYHGATGAFLAALVPSGSGGLDGPTGLLFTGDGKLYVSSAFTHSVKRYDATSGSYIDDFVVGGAGGLVFPHEITFGPDGHFYVVSGGTDGVKRYDGTSGSFLGDFVAAGAGGISAPQAMIFTPAAPPACGCSDADGDGFGSPGAASCPNGPANDCDDLDASTSPGATELCDGRDNDCDGGAAPDETDADGDGFRVCAADCDDADASVNPDGVELPGNLADENCDGSLGACDPSASWRNHGQFVRCVAHEVNALRAAGLISEEDGDDLVRAAAQSSVGK
jgi:streptogramin lyase